MQVQKAIQKRLSIRQYADASIPDEHMEILFKALQLAPSANTLQNWEFVFVKDSDLKQRLVRACFNQRFVKDSAYFIAGVADPIHKWYMVDITISLTHFTLQAVELGYGTCWIGAFDPVAAREILELPDEVEPVVFTTLGYPDAPPRTKKRKPLSELVRYERW